MTLLRMMRLLMILVLLIILICNRWRDNISGCADSAPHEQSLMRGWHTRRPARVPGSATDPQWLPDGWGTLGLRGAGQQIAGCPLPQRLARGTLTRIHPIIEPRKHQRHQTQRHQHHHAPHIGVPVRILAPSRSVNGSARR